MRAASGEDELVGDGPLTFPADPVIDAYKPGIDRTLIAANLERTPDERLANLAALQRFVAAFRGAAADTRSYERVIDIERALRVLSEGRVEFIVVGGVAAALLGSARFTSDLDLVYSRSPQNIERLAAALAPHRPYLRGAPPGLPFLFNVDTISLGLSFTLVTDLGALALLGEVAGGGDYGALLPHSVAMRARGLEIQVLGLDKLIHVKRAAGRPKDLEAIAELEMIREERQKRGL